VASPSGGKSEYFTGRKNGLVASVSAGRIIFTFIVAPFAEETGSRADLKYFILQRKQEG
jgi:hypothetical protein